MKHGISKLARSLSSSFCWKSTEACIVLLDSKLPAISNRRCLKLRLWYKWCRHNKHFCDASVIWQRPNTSNWINVADTTARQRKATQGNNIQELLITLLMTFLQTSKEQNLQSNGLYFRSIVKEESAAKRLTEFGATCGSRNWEKSPTMEERDGSDCKISLSL